MLFVIPRVYNGRECLAGLWCVLHHRVVYFHTFSAYSLVYGDVPYTVLLAILGGKLLNKLVEGVV
jgi:hypothetical protein